VALYRPLTIGAIQKLAYRGREGGEILSVPRLEKGIRAHPPNCNPSHSEEAGSGRGGISFMGGLREGEG